jgi:hypothetical protein
MLSGFISRREDFHYWVIGISNILGAIKKNAKQASIM